MQSDKAEKGLAVFGCGEVCSSTEKSLRNAKGNLSKSDGRGLYREAKKLFFQFLDRLK